VAHVSDVAAGGVQPMAGDLEVRRDAVCFTPRFDFVEGASYTVRMGDRTWTLRRGPRQASPRTQVLAVYPTAAELPVNQLKLYVLFSDAMSEGWAARAVSLRRADDGAPLAGAFAPMDPELWDPGRTRLTLLLEPGRIKRGLAPHEEVGYPLTLGMAIVVAVDRSFHDADGLPLVAGAERRYRVGPAVRSRVDPRAWAIEAPAAGSHAPLVVDFGRPLDRALLAHSLTVANDAGAEVSGRASVLPGDRRWQFVPELAWTPGPHRLTIEARLEDLAGNSLTRVFDRDLARPEDDPLDIVQATVEFGCS
jgi:hypothetical protein